MIYKRVDGVVWNAQSHGRLRASGDPKAHVSTEEFQILAGLVSSEEFKGTR